MTGLPRTLVPLLALTFAAAAGACGGGQVPAPNRLWTGADLEFEANQNPDCHNPGGLTGVAAAGSQCNYFVGQSPGGYDYFQFKLAFSEGAPMAYITTDFWANYDRIWLQPMYFLVTAWDAQNPDDHRLAGAAGETSKSGPIFSVGTDSAFYSPFWSVFYAVVPEGTPPDKYTSARQLFDDGLVMHQGANRYASVVPGKLQLPAAADIRGVVPNLNDYFDSKLAISPDTILQQVMDSAQRFTGWVDGAAVEYVDFGPDNFVANDAREVQDVPLFLFIRRSAGPGLDLLGAPNVGGVAPLFSELKGRVSAGLRPQFGGLWRIYLVTVPATAGMLTTDDFPGGVVPAALINRIQRVALDRACFVKLASDAMDTSCVWLDSQDAIERNIGPGGITRTGLQPACPFVMWRGTPVPRQ